MNFKVINFQHKTFSKANINRVYIDPGLSYLRQGIGNGFKKK